MHDRKCRSLIVTEILVLISLYIAGPSLKMSVRPRRVRNLSASPSTSPVGRPLSPGRQNARHAARMRSVGPCSAGPTEL